jgi:mannose-6-phosphate isomerase-like protein (cupin superfamily)
MIGWVNDIEQFTAQNTNFRSVLYTGEHSQLTVMSLKPGEEIGNELHAGVDQFIRIERGRGKVTFSNNENEIQEEYEVQPDWAAIIPAGIWHNVVNIGDEDLKLYSIYSPANHPRGVVHATKADADAAEAAEHTEQNNQPNSAV